VEGRGGPAKSAELEQCGPAGGWSERTVACGLLGEGGDRSVEAVMNRVGGILEVPQVD
jgi:hypothetical protein